MIKLIALYEQPDDEAAFWEHYEKVHAPLTRELPGLVDLELLRVTADAFGGEAPFYLVATMSFSDRDAFKAAMRSEENKRLGQDLLSFAKGKVKVLVSETKEV